VTPCARTSRQHQIEHDHVELLRQRAAQTGGEPGGGHEFDAGLSQRAFEQVARGRAVFDQQDAHGPGPQSTRPQVRPDNDGSTGRIGPLDMRISLGIG
jgi:hypothetical protein